MGPIYFNLSYCMGVIICVHYNSVNSDVVISKFKPEAMALDMISIHLWKNIWRNVAYINYILNCGYFVKWAKKNNISCWSSLIILCVCYFIQVFYNWVQIIFSFEKQRY